MQLSNQLTFNKLFRFYTVLAVVLLLFLFWLKHVFIFQSLFIISIGVFIAFFLLLLNNTRQALYFCFFLIPLSVAIKYENINLGISLPSELMLGVLSIIFLISVTCFQRVNKDFIKHPLSLAVILYLLVILLTTIFSTMPVVSIKSTVAQFVFVFTAFYLTGNLLINENSRAKEKILLAYGSGLSLVIIYIIFKFSHYDFNIRMSPWMPAPFYNDHTILSACISMILAVFLFQLIAKSRVSKLLIFILCIILLAGLYFSFSRAGWLSFVLAMGLSFTAYLGFRFKHLMISFLLLTTLIVINHERIRGHISGITASSTERMDLSVEEQIQSIANVKTDVSNVERINRWKSAIRMFKEKPLTGFGPATYQFKYHDYQRTNEMTGISMRTSIGEVPLGFGGSVHSEYLLSLSESGFAGLISWLAICFFAIRTGFNCVKNTTNEKDKAIALGCLAGISSYIIHALFNNFLDVEKAAMLFWSLLAILVAIDLKYRKKN